MHPSTATVLNVFLTLGLGMTQIIPHLPRGEMLPNSPELAAKAAPRSESNPDPAGADAAAPTAPAPTAPAPPAPPAPPPGGAPAPPSPGGSPAPAAGAAGGATAACSQSMILAQGIALNIQDQQQELATAQALQTTLSSQPVDTATWATQRTALLQFVNNGIAIREMNQLITPAGNKATSGIAVVANAQLTELGLATNLTAMGSDNLPGNMQILQMLQMDFSGGIKQNMQNMANAMTGCTAAAGAGGGAGAAPTPAAPAPAPSGAGKVVNKVGVLNEGPNLSGRFALPLAA